MDRQKIYIYNCWTRPQIFLDQKKIEKINCIGASIRIGREILCLPYAGFLLIGTVKKITNIFIFSINNFFLHKKIEIF